MPASPVSGFCFDSRKINRGDLFVALRSDKADGHDYVVSALGAGAAGALVSRDFAAKAAAAGNRMPLLAVDDTLRAFQRIARGWRDRTNPFIVGVTGSVGKSTVKEWTAAILGDWRKTSATKANFNNDIGLPASLLSIAPDASFGVFEAGVSHPGDMAPLVDAMRPDAAIVTAIAPVHTEFLGSLAGIAAEKAGILRALPEDGFAVLDARGAFFDYLSSQARCRVVGACVVHPGEEPPATAKYVARMIDEATCRFDLDGPGLEQPIPANLGRPGAHNALNAVLAVAAARECGVPWETIGGRLSALPGVSMRWERLSSGGLDWICDAYNANPIAMVASVRAFAMAVPATAATARAFVLGDMFELGQDEVEYHRSVAKVLGEIETSAGDILVCTGKLARNYATPGFRGRTFFADDALGAAIVLRREAAPGSAVLLKASHGMRLDTVPRLFETPLPEIALRDGAPPVAILGAGRSGLAAKAILEAHGARTILLEGETQFPTCPVALAVASPGIPDGHPWLEQCARRGIRTIGELELGWLFWRGHTIAVTGSKGKSSVVKLCADTLAANGRAATPCGNYGAPLSEIALAPHSHGDWAVVEASSFQLQRIEHFRPDIAVLLNLQADHLDRHGTMAAYAEAKFSIFKNFDASTCLAVAAREAFETAMACGASIREWPHGETREALSGAILIRGAGAPQKEPAPPLTGYFANPILAPAAVSAAIALGAAGLTPGEIRAGTEGFKPLPHRMQVVAERYGVTFIDNSKATSLAALAASLEMAGKPVRLIAGGRIKESDCQAPKKNVALFAKKVYLIGEASQTLFEAWGDTVPCEICATMRTAVKAAAREARQGEAVLLAPGCASFDQYPGYAARGDDFARCVAEADGN